LFNNNIRVKRWIDFLIEKDHEVSHIFLDNEISSDIPNIGYSSLNLALRKSRPKFDVVNKTEFTWEKKLVKFSITELLFFIKLMVITLIRGVMINSYLKKIKVDAIIVQGYFGFMLSLGYMIYKILFRMKIPIYFVMWGTSPVNKMIYYMKKLYFRNTSKIMTNMELKKFYVENYKLDEGKFFIQFWGLDLNRNYIVRAEHLNSFKEKYGICKDDNIFFHNRLITPQYNIEDLIKIVKRSSEIIPKFKLVLIQGTDLKSEYGSKILKEFDRLGLSGNILYIPSIVDYDEMKYFHSISIAVLSTIKHDAFCASVMEAMACGGVPVYYELSSYKEHLKHKENVLFAPVGNLDKFTDNVIEVYRNRQLRHQIQENNLNCIKKIGDVNINFGKFIWKMT
jgi:glycosyltransferase involved in cell wall biosynthesis